MDDQEKKRRVLRSRAFAIWWDARKKESPRPSNPYQAYMIDLSLRAIIDRPQNWKREPNRRDLPEIDSPFSGVPTYAPAFKPRRRREAPYKSPELPKSREARELTLFVESMATAHGQPAPLIHFKRLEGPLTSEASVGLGRFGGAGPLVRSGGGEMVIGIAGKARIQKIASAAHETDHIIHAQNLFDVGFKLEGIPPYTGRSKSYSDEQVATKLARRHLKKTLKAKGEYPAATWFLGYALHTYRQDATLRGHPFKVNRQGNIIG